MLLIYKEFNIDIPYEAIRVEDMKITMSLNDHGQLYIKLLIAEGKVAEYTNKDLSNEKIAVSNKNESDNSKLFIGKIRNVHMVYENDVLMMELNCISFTKQFDIKKNSRTFCNLDMTYNEVIDKVLESYDKKNYVYNLENNDKIGEFILQYEETDWEFLKRIASHFNALLVPEVTEEYGRFYFGLPELYKKNEIILEDYEVLKDIDSYNKREYLGLEDNFIQEYTKWTVVCNENLLLGEKVIFNNISCIVSKIDIEIYKEEVRKIYTLCIKRGLRSIYKTNKKIFGMGLPATVKDVQGNTMSVHFHIDEKNESHSNEKYFTYAIESSSWYCMPEKESIVHIYFPTNDESEAIAVHAVRNTDANGQYSSKTQNPDIKSFSHTAGSGMALSPSDINFAADNSNSVAVNMSQSGDISICGQNVNIIASEDIQLGMRDGAGGEEALKPQVIQLSAGKKIGISKGNICGIEIVDETFIQGPLIKYEGTIKDAIELPEAIANRNKDDEARINDINAQAEAVERQKVQEAKNKTGFGVFACVVGAVAIVAAGAAIVATGGVGTVAAVALVSGTFSAISGAAMAKEGMQDYAKALDSGDFSRSSNFVRDTVFGGNDTLYNLVTYGAVLVSGVCITILSAGATAEFEGAMTKEAMQAATKKVIKEAIKPAIKKAAMDAIGDIGLNAMMDYGQDGRIDMSPIDYIKSACTVGGSGGLNNGVINGLKKVEKVGLGCKTIGKLRVLGDTAISSLTDYATTGESDISKNLLRSYVSNKFCFSDPVDGATGSLYIPATDIVLPDINDEFKIERKYESVNPRVGVLGKCWTTNFETTIEIKDNSAYVLCTDGHIETFNKINDEWVNDKGAAEIYTLKAKKDCWIFKSHIDKKIYTYDLSGKILKVIDKVGNELTFTYVENHIETLTTFSNYKLFFTYKDNKVIQIKDELGRTVQYRYNGDYLTEVIHVDQGITRYTYNEEGFIDSITDQNGQTYTKNFFDKNGRVIRQDFPNNDNCVITYDDINKEVSFYYEQSKRTEKTRFNKDGLITHLFYEDGTTEEFKYDEYENKNYIKDRNGFETFKVFNEYGSLLKETLSNGLVKEYVYDEEQNLLKERDNLGKEILFTYDNKGNLLEKKTKISVGEYKTESYTYDSYGRITAKVDGNGNISKYEYDSGSFIEGKKGKDPVRVITNSGYDYEYEYDEVGRNTSISTDYGTIEFGYNNLDYVSKIKDGNGNVTLKYYDKMGNLISIYTPNACLNNKQNGQGYYYKYDHMDRLISIKNPLGIIDKSIRDSEGNIIKEINPNYYDDKTDNGLGIEHVYDKDNRKIKTIYPDGGIERFYYDANGNVIRHISPEYYNKETDNGTGFSYTYDSMNKLTSIYNEETGITEKTFEYDLHGNIIKEIDNDKNATLFKYDLANNLIEKKVPVEIVNSDSNESLESKNKYQVTSYCYDKNGNKILEKHGIDAVFEDEICNNYNEIYFTYDKENRLIEVKEKCGAKARYKYDCLNHKIYESFKINDTTNKIIHYIYDKVGNLVEKKEEIDGKFISSKNKGKNIWSITKYEYDKNGNLTKIITPKGYEIVKVYDEIDRVIEEHEKDETNNIFRSRVYNYDKANNIISINEYSGEEAKLINSKYSSEFNYDLDILKRHENKKENEKLLKKIDLKIDKRKKNYIYDSQNRLTHFTNVSGNTARLFYDKNDRIIKQVLPEQYDNEKDNGVGTTYKYNIKGQVVEVKNALGETVTKNTYDPKGNLKTSVDGENNKVEYTYTLLGQIKDVVTPNSKKENKKAQSYSYDARGNITGITDGNGNETSYLLDHWGRIIQITTPEGGIEKYTYDYAGNIASTTDANGGIIEYFYNSLGQVCEIKDQEGNSEYFYYDEEGNLIKHIDRNENIVNRKYNIDRNIVSVEGYKLDNKAIENEKIESKNSETLSLEQGKPKRSRDFRKRVLENLERKEKGLENNYPYKTENKINDEVNEYEKYKLNVISQRFKYNPDGTLNNAYTGNMMYNYTYNDEKLLESKSASGRTLISYIYDKNNNIKSIKDITGKSSIYSYDDADRVKTIVDDNQNTLASYDYYRNDNIKSITLGNGIESYYTYDGDGNVESLVTITSNGEVLVDYKYAYDLNGNRLQKVSSKHKNFYSYDSMNRLVDSRYDERCESFTYDKVGNRLTKTTNDITEKYVYNVKNQLKELHNKNGVNYFTYDKQGNTIKEETKDGNNIFEYNTLNQAVKAITKEGSTLVSRYDTEGLRTEIEENEKLSKFIFNKNGDILVETDPDDNVISRFTRGYEIVAADIADKASSSINYSLSRCYYSVDEQGSTDFITDDSGNIKNEYYYDAFGNVLDSGEEVHNRITYTGQQFDGITQQYYLRARFYNPVIGRFTQEDVYRGDGLNLYAYCGNNPVRYYDPSGYGRTPKPIDIKDNELVKDVLYRTTEGKNIIPRGEEFNEWFDSLTQKELEILYSNNKTKSKITGKGGLRGEGGFHEWYKVSKAPLFKSWGMTANQIKTAVTKTKEMNFYNIETTEGIKNGVHGTDTASVSAYAHISIDELADSSSGKSEFDSRLKSWADEHFARSIVDDNGNVKIIAGSKGLPDSFQDDNKNIEKNDRTSRCAKK